MRRFRLRPRHIWWIPALGVAIYANVQAQAHGLGLAPVLIFGIAPHVPAWLQMRPIVSSLLHQPALPVAVVALGVVGVLSPFWLVGGQAWVSHILGDRAVGFGRPSRPATEPTVGRRRWSLA
jgi:hypothetical protein